MNWLMLCRAPWLYSCQRLQQACEQRGISLDILDPNRFLLQLGQHNQLFYQADEHASVQPLPEYQAVLPRFGASSTVFGSQVLKQLELQGTVALNEANAFALARDKWRSLQVLQACNLPIPNSFLGGELLSASGRFSQQNGKIVLKPLSGMQGEGVTLWEKSAAENLASAEIQQQISQDFIYEAQGCDIRAFVVGDRVVAAMKRCAAKGDFRANIHQGGSAQAVELDEKTAKLAVQASLALGLDVAGVDLIQSAAGAMLLEVNASAGLEMIEKTSGVDIAGIMVEYLINKVKNNGRV